MRGVRKPLGLSSEDSIEGARLAASNARDLLSAAIAVSDVSRFGPATSLLVLAVEEGVKAFSLLFNSLSPNTRVPLEPIFSKHRVKHEIGASISFMAHVGVIMRDARDAVEKSIEVGCIEEKKAGGEWVSRVILELNRMKDNACEEEMRFLSWYRSANALKNDGFYVDWSAGSWRMPSSFSCNTFEMYRGYATWWLDVVDHVLALPIEFLESTLAETERAIEKHVRSDE